ncbi:MAG: restriction endonuclease [Candidatus Electronema sp. V4]|uniref:restriction endonuclease n=1 Tax=Candidatus Electronema sp. V4 TaxID=3454756 RepID=UPI0040556881
MFKGGLISTNNIHLIFAMRTCHDCGKVLCKNREGKVPPCPDCGSTVSDLMIGISETVGIVEETKIVIPENTPSILLQSFVIPLGKTPEGTLIQAALVPWHEIIKLITQDPNAIFQIEARRWEEIIAAAYEQAGFDEVILTPRSGDYGRDVIAVKKGLGEVRIIDQVKAYKHGHPVTANDVRALMGVLQTDGASKGFLTTTSDFAPKLKDDPLITPLIPQRLGLINGKQLVARLQDIANNR